MSDQTKDIVTPSRLSYPIIVRNAPNFLALWTQYFPGITYVEDVRGDRKLLQGLNAALRTTRAEVVVKKISRAQAQVLSLTTENKLCLKFAPEIGWYPCVRNCYVINKGDFMLYAGEVIRTDPSAHPMAAISAYQLTFPNTRYAINAHKFRNFAGLVAHGWLKDRAPPLADAIDMRSIAWANMEFQLLKLKDNSFLPIMIAIETIIGGQPPLIDYGEGFWLSPYLPLSAKRLPKFFNIRGEIIYARFTVCICLNIEGHGRLQVLESGDSAFLQPGLQYAAIKQMRTLVPYVYITEPFAANVTRDEILSIKVIEHISLQEFWQRFTPAACELAFYGYQRNYLIIDNNHCTPDEVRKLRDLPGTQASQTKETLVVIAALVNREKLMPTIMDPDNYKTGRPITPGLVISPAAAIPSAAPCANKSLQLSL